MCLTIVIIVNIFIFKFFFSFQIRDDEYDWPTPHTIRNIRNNGPDIEALDNLEPYQADDLENGEVCIIFISNIHDRSQL